MAENSRGGSSTGARGTSGGRSGGRGGRQNTSGRGFAAMDPEERKEVSRRGGVVSGSSRKGRERGTSSGSGSSSSR